LKRKITIAFALPKLLVFGLSVMFALFTLQLKAQADDPDYEEISVFVRVQQIGGFDMTGIFHYTTNKFYLSPTDLFTILRINQETHPGFDSITGFFIDENNSYVIDYPNRQIRVGSATYNLSEDEMLKTETGMYLYVGVYGRAFGLHCTFNFRALTVEIRSDVELPAIREMRLKQMRQNIERLRGEVSVDTTIPRHYHMFKFGMLDWSVNSTQVTGKTTDTRILTGVGAELLGGETNLLFNYSTRDGYNSRNQQFWWQWVDNSASVFKQVRAGRISAGTIASVYDPVLGVTATNAPTTYRRSFGEYTLTDFTEPGWTVELYINNVIVDYITADASGFYSFDIPLVYGNSDVMLKFYGPYGEERTKEQTISIPFNFLPSGEVEYTVNAGVVQDTNNSILSRGEINYGINRFVTVGGGLEYLSSIKSGSEIPFLQASVTPHPNILLTGEYNHGVVSKGKMTYRNRSNMLFEFDYANYAEEQQAIRFNYLEERKLTVAIPLRFPFFKGYTRMGIKQNVYEVLTYNTAEFTLSSFFGPVNVNFTGFANWIDRSTPFISSNFAAGIRLGQGFNVRTQTQFDVTNYDIISYRVELEKRISRHGYLSANYEENLRASASNVSMSFRYDLPFAQANMSNRYGNKVTTTTQGARGSLAFGSGKGYVHADNRSALGRGGITIVPFLDINHNGRQDNGEPLVEGLNARLNGGRVLTRVSDTLTRIIELEPYTSYLLELQEVGFENIAWQLRLKNMSIFVDPNQFKTIEIPVLPMGEINGMVYIQRNGTMRGIGRVLVNIYTEDGDLVKKIMTESDGYYTFLGMPPGSYYAMIDPGQRKRLKMTSQPEKIEFHIVASEWGDIIDGLDFILQVEDEGKASMPDDADQNIENTADIIKTEETKPDPEITEQQTDTITETEPEEASQTDKSPPKPQQLDERAGGYFVQVGAFNTEPEAVERKAAIDSVFSYPTGIIFEDNFYKLRLGYFSRKADADACYLELIENGFNAFIGEVTRQEKESSQKPQQLDERAGRYYVQVGAFNTEPEAVERKAAVDSVFSYPTGIIFEDNFYKLRLGYFSRKADADACYLELIENGFNAFVGEVTWQEKEPSQKPQQLDERAGMYYVQVGAFNTEPEAAEREAAIDSVFSYPTGVIFEDNFYKLRLGYFRRKADADACYNELIENGFNAFVGIVPRERSGN
jgi:cell division protein FtsN